MTQTGPIVTLEVAKQGAIYHGLAGILAQPSPLIPRGMQTKSHLTPNLFLLLDHFLFCHYSRYSFSLFLFLSIFSFFVYNSSQIVSSDLLPQSINHSMNLNKSYENSLNSSPVMNSKKDSNSSNTLISDSTYCASNIFDDNISNSDNKLNDSSLVAEEGWETVQTLDRASLRSKQKRIVTTTPKKTTSSSYLSLNPLTYLKSALFPQKLLKSKLKSKSKTSSKRAMRQSTSLIIANNQTQQMCSCNNKNCFQNNNKLKPFAVLNKCKSDESLNSNPNSVCSCVSNCSVCNDILNNCEICQHLNRYYAKSLKIKSENLNKSKILNLNQISLAKCECVLCLNSYNTSYKVSQTSSMSGIIQFSFLYFLFNFFSQLIIGLNQSCLTFRKKTLKFEFFA